MLDERTRPQRPGLAGAANETDGRLAAGDRVGQWIVAARLGGGGFADVYEVEHATTRQRAAAKVLHAQLATSPQIKARFDREIELLIRLRHPNIVDVYDAGLDDSGRPFLCMELLVGQDLSRIVRKRGPLSPAHAHALYEPLCDALALAHAQGVVHRDIKASNVFVCDTDRVVLLDFGIAKLSDAFAPELTASNQTLGTPGCMPPEQIQGARIDARTDVYALGGMLFYLLTATLPFQDPSETMTQYLHLHAKRPRASSVVPAVPSAVDDVIVRAMAIDPRARYESTQALLAALRNALRESPGAAHVTTGEHAALFITVEDATGGAELDEPLIADLESVLPSAERALADRGYMLALELGSSAVFVAPCTAPEDAVDAARMLWQQLAARPGRDSRVRVGIAVHRAPATIVGSTVEPGPLLQLERWGMPAALDGVWFSAAFAATGTR